MEFDFDKLEEDMAQDSLTLGMTNNEILRTFYTLLHVASTVGQGADLWQFMSGQVDGLVQYEDADALRSIEREGPDWYTMIDVLDSCVPLGTRWLVDWLQEHRLPYVATWMPIHGEWVYITFGDLARIKEDFDVGDLDI